MKWICGPKTGSHKTNEKTLIKRCLSRAAFRGFRWFSVQKKIAPTIPKHYCWWLIFCISWYGKISHCLTGSCTSQVVVQDVFPLNSRPAMKPTSSSCSEGIGSCDGGLLNWVMALKRGGGGRLGWKVIIEWQIIDPLLLAVYIGKLPI